MSDRCPASFWGSHAYEARYDEQPNAAFFKFLERASKARGLDRENMTIRIYVHDVCVHCGDVVDRIDPGGPKR